MARRPLRRPAKEVIDAVMAAPRPTPGARRALGGLSR